MSKRQAPITLLGFRPGAGGIPRVMLDLIDGFHHNQTPVDLLLPEGDYPDLARLSTPVPPCFPLSSEDRPRARQELVAYLKQRQPAAMLSNKDRTSALLAEMRALGTQLPPVWLRIGSDVREKIRSKLLWRRPAYRAGLLRTYRAADGLIANSMGVAESLEDLLYQDNAQEGPPIRTIPNPLNLQRIRDLSTAPAPHPWLEDQRTPVILGMGRLVAVKDFPVLIRAFARLRQAHTGRPARLIIFGEGRQRATLERLIRRLGLTDDIALPGYTDNPFAALSRATLFVLSSRYEGAPNVLIEALACTTPCVSTDCRSGPRDILDQGRLGPLTPVGDVAALASAMSQTLDAPPATDRLLAAAQRFDLGISVAAYLDALGIQPPAPSLL